ncbi:MAG TPA: peptide chain release factor N(5)-glutamine methyltransferase [Kofleriaceae bacterium]|nr:peptide chain release factor N(5)-glutamine methyltransferase [Kofleriaceae bacterium]
MDETWTPLRVLEWTTRRLATAGVDAARLEAQVLLAHALACDRVALYTMFDKPLAPEELTRYRDLVKRRLAGEPVAYLVGHQEFWSLDLAVDPRVLIPRRDTETAVELVLDRIADRAAAIAVADVATGAGPLALAMARELPAARVVATDLSEDALEVARGNAERLGLADRIELRAGDLLTALPEGVLFDVLVSNPPYVKSGDIAGLSPEVRREPRAALDGGADGLDALRRLAAGAAPHLRPGGLIALEHGFDQGAEVRALLDATGAFTPAATRADLGGQPRVTFARRLEVAPAIAR